MRTALTKDRGPQNAYRGVSLGTVNLSEEGATDSRDSLHTKDKGVLGKVARVAQAVLLPQLAKQVLHATHGPEVVGEVALKKGVNAPAQDEPHDGREIAAAQRWSDLLHQDIGDAEDDCAARRKHGEQLQRVPFVGQVAHDLRLDGIVGVDLPREEREVAGSHGEGEGEWLGR